MKPCMSVVRRVEPTYIGPRHLVVRILLLVGALRNVVGRSAAFLVKRLFAGHAENVCVWS